MIVKFKQLDVNVDITGNEEKIEELLNEVVIFCERVDKGEVRSVKTYGKFKNILEKITGFTWEEIKEYK
jgi:hypothetical protein